MDPTQLASTISTLQGLITGAVGCTILSVLANLVLWRRLTKVQDDLPSLVKETREVNLRMEHVLDAILVEMRRANGLPNEISGQGLRRAP